MAARDERDNKNREARQAQRDNAAEGPRTEDRVADTLAQKKALLEVSEKASQERDQRGVDAREKDRELGDRQRSDKALRLSRARHHQHPIARVKTASRLRFSRVPFNPTPGMPERGGWRSPFTTGDKP